MFNPFSACNKARAAFRSIGRALVSRFSSACVFVVVTRVRWFPTETKTPHDLEQWRIRSIALILPLSASGRRGATALGLRCAWIGLPGQRKCFVASIIPLWHRGHRYIPLFPSFPAIEGKAVTARRGKERTYLARVSLAVKARLRLANWDFNIIPRVKAGTPSSSIKEHAAGEKRLALISDRIFYLNKIHAISSNSQRGEENFTVFFKFLRAKFHSNSRVTIEFKRSFTCIRWILHSESLGEYFRNWRKDLTYPSLQEQILIDWNINSHGVRTLNLSVTYDFGWQYL